MANKTVPKRKHMGYELLINQTGQKGADNWTRVTGVFNSMNEAQEFAKRRYPGLGVKQAQVKGIYFSALPKIIEKFIFSVEKPKETKKGGNNATK